MKNQEKNKTQTTYHQNNPKEVIQNSDLIIPIFVILLLTIAIGILVFSMPKNQFENTNSFLNQTKLENCSQKFCKTQSMQNIKIVLVKQKNIHNQTLKHNQTPINTTQRAQNHERFYARLTIAHPYPGRNV
jgi:uncharacterized protein HemX